MQEANSSAALDAQLETIAKIEEQIANGTNETPEALGQQLELEKNLLLRRQRTALALAERWLDGDAAVTAATRKQLA